MAESTLVACSESSACPNLSDAVFRKNSSSSSMSGSKETCFAAPSNAFCSIDIHFAVTDY